MKDIKIFLKKKTATILVKRDLTENEKQRQIEQTRKYSKLGKNKASQIKIS